jgi:hypothetical protein
VFLSHRIKKTRVLFVLVDLLWLFLEHAHEVFDEILMRETVVIVSFVTLACTVSCFSL